MTTNQTIDGVPRALLASFAAYVADSPNAIMRSRAAELRALLDAPAKAGFTDETVATIIRDICEHEPDDNPDSAHISIKALELILLQNLEGLVKPAEQPAPVAVVLPERLNHSDGLHTYEYVTGHNAAIDKMLGVKS